jgi:hypothetical protein
MPQFRDENERNMLSTSQQIITLKIASGKTMQVPGYGNRYYCKELYAQTTFTGVADIEIQTDLSSKRPLNLGMGEVVPDGSYFTTLTLFNPSSNPDIVVELYAGFGDIIDNRLNVVRERPAGTQPVMDAQTSLIASPVNVTNNFVIAAGATLALDGVPPTGYAQRRSFTVANLDANAVLQIVDSAGKACAAVFGTSTQIYYISGAVGIKNGTGAAVSAYVGEVWYANGSA